MTDFDVPSPPAATRDQQVALLRGTLAARHSPEYLTDPVFHQQIHELAETVMLTVDSLAAARTARAASQAEAYRKLLAGPASPGTESDRPEVPAPAGLTSGALLASLARVPGDMQVLIHVPGGDVLAVESARPDDTCDGPAVFRIMAEEAPGE